MLALVHKNGICLKDADEALKGDVEVVRAACKQNAAAILHCAPGPIQQSLIRDKDFMVDIFSRWPCRDTELCGRGGELYTMLSADMKLDHDIVFAAYRQKCLTVPDLPTELTSDRGFWMDMIQRQSHFWFFLPQEFEGDPVFASAIKDFEDSDMVRNVFRSIPFPP